MRRLPATKPVSSSRLQPALHPAAASVPEEALLLKALALPEALRRLKASHHLSALDHPEASEHLSAARPRVVAKRLSSCRLPEAYLPEASARRAGSLPAVLAHREFDRERARRREGYQARVRRHLQQASCLPGIRDQIFLASFIWRSIEWIKKFSSAQSCLE